MPSGTDQVLKNLNLAIRQIKNRTTIGVKLAAFAIKAESQFRCPVDTGHLKGSHYVQMETSNDGSPMARIGATAEYALIQHENLQFRHPNGEAKFLENAFKAKAGDVLEIIRRTAKV